MFEEKFGKPIEDPTRQLREDLVGELEKIATADDAEIMKKFKKGVFLIPSETTNGIQDLIDNVPDTEKQKELRRIYNSILSQA